jgi:hypothetical protein
MTYNRYALERGGLEIIYNRRGQIVDIGICKGGGRYAYNQDNDYGYDHNDDDDDDDHYYYRTNGTKAKIEDTKVSKCAIRIDRK